MMPAATGRKRTQSRASTASAQSAYGDSPALYSGQWVPNDRVQAKPLAPAAVPVALAQLASSEEILQAASQLHSHSHSHSSREFSMDPSVNASVEHSASFHHHRHNSIGGHVMPPHMVPADGLSSVDNSFVDGDSQMMDRDANEDADSVAGGGAKPSRSSANNELEMRQLFAQNRDRTLEEVAGELHGNERGPHSERTRQVFAMLWINSVCSKGKGSVPRGRVYANYASRCAHERITVLNPASFGKLVRVLFPGLKTRRLGVRGESKYHYVNFHLTEEQPELKELAGQPQVPLMESTSIPQNFNSIPSRATSVRPERTALPSPDPQQEQERPRMPRSHEHQHSLYNQPSVLTIDDLSSSTAKTAIMLSLSPDSDTAFKQSDPVVLPRIEPFLPPGTDRDAATALAALYRSHCTSLIECIRYCKEKTFFHLFTSFQGTLTMPVQKLFGNPAIAPWIEECDFVLYQRMMRIVAGLTLQVVPKPVLDTLRSISERLVPHIREAFQGQPPHVVKAKEAAASLFAGLLDRALRVNLTAHAAANILSNPANRDEMYIEWITLVRLRKVGETVPTRAMDDVVSLLLAELRDLLDPVNVPWEVEACTLYGEMALRNGSGRPPFRTSGGGGMDDDDLGASNVLDRWVALLQSLPSRFPFASPTDIVSYTDRLGTAVIRDLTIGSGKSFGSWWVTKCWIDEMVSFMAEQGGFLKMKSSHETSTATAAAAATGTTTTTSTTTQQSQQQGHQQSHTNSNNNSVKNREASQAGSRYSSGSDDFNVSHGGSTNMNNSQMSSYQHQLPQQQQQQQYQASHHHHQQHSSLAQPDRAPFPSAPNPTPHHAEASHHHHHGAAVTADVTSATAMVTATVSTVSVSVSNMSSTSAASNNHDDSGIGIRTPDEDFPAAIDKFEFPSEEATQELINGAVAEVQSQQQLSQQQQSQQQLQQQQMLQQHQHVGVSAM